MYKSAPTAVVGKHKEPYGLKRNTADEQVTIVVATHPKFGRRLNHFHPAYFLMHLSTTD